MACLAGCAPKGEPLVITSIPWTEDETATYSIQTQAGETLGSATISIIQDGDTWALTDHQVVNNTPDDIKLTVNAKDLKPLSEERTLVIPTGGSIPEGTWKISATFSEDKLTVEADTLKGTKDQPNSSSRKMPLLMTRYSFYCCGRCPLQKVIPPISPM